MEMQDLRISPVMVANDIIRKAQVNEPPVDFDRCLSLFPGLGVVRDTLEGTGYLVHLSPDESQIIVNRKSSVGRQRFTAAHELGHWILERIATKERRSSVPEKKESTDEERWCETFAVSFLMPEYWVRAFVLESGGLCHPRVLFLGPQHFKVSKEAFYVRLNDLYGVVVVERDARSVEARMALYPQRYHSPETEEAVIEIGKRRFGEDVWDSREGGVTGGPYWTRIGDERKRLAFVLRGSADPVSGANAKLSSYSCIDE